MEVVQKISSGLYDVRDKIGKYFSFEEGNFPNVYSVHSAFLDLCNPVKPPTHTHTKQQLYNDETNFR